METDKEEKQNPAPESGNVGESFVGPFGIFLTATYLVVFTFLLLNGLLVFWERVPSSTTTVDIISFLWKFKISDELALVINVALAGALGGLVHALRSLYRYTGNRELRRCWLTMYVLLPFVGLTLALIFYFVIRGGSFLPQAQAKETSPFGFVALASLVGLLSEQAVLKLKDVS